MFKKKTIKYPVVYGETLDVGNRGDNILRCTVELDKKCGMTLSTDKLGRMNRWKRIGYKEFIIFDSKTEDNYHINKIYNDIMERAYQHFVTRLAEHELLGE